MNCQDCKYFNNDDELYCAVNPIAAEAYHSDRPNDCNDFESISGSVSEESLDSQLGQSNLEERHQSEAGLAASRQVSSSDFSFSQSQAWLAEQRQQFDAHQRQLTSSGV